MNRPTIHAVYHGKGGVGKTTTTHNTAINLAALGWRVLCIDLDPQHGLTKLASPLRSGRNGHILTIGSVLGGSVAPTATLSQAALTTEYGYDFVPASLDLSNVAAGLERLHFGRLEALGKAIEADGSRWDIILIDCPPDTDILPINALMAADGVIIPCEPEPLAIAGLVQVADVLGQVEAARGRNIRREYVATKVDGRTNQHADGLANLKEEGAVVVIPRRNGAGAGAELLAAYVPLAQRLAGAVEGVG